MKVDRGLHRSGSYGRMFMKSPKLGGWQSRGLSWIICPMERPFNPLVPECSKRSTRFHQSFSWKLVSTPSVLPPIRQLFPTHTPLPSSSKLVPSAILGSELALPFDDEQERKKIGGSMVLKISFKLRPGSLSPRLRGLGEVCISFCCRGFFL